MDEDKLRKAGQLIVVALDTRDIDIAMSLVRDLGPHVWGFKLGIEFLTATYTCLITGGDAEAHGNLVKLRSIYGWLGRKIFWDQKWNDISNSVAGAVKSLAPVSPYFLDVHANAGDEAIREAVANRGTSNVLGVTVLTSLKEMECKSIFGDTPKKKVLAFAQKLLENNAQGIICSGQELGYLSEAGYLPRLTSVVPGIRPPWAQTNDQNRTMTPKEAIREGASLVVIGRPITQPPRGIDTPINAVRLIAEEISEVI